MKCSDVLRKISAYSDNEVSADVSLKIAGHLDHCAECRKAYASFQEIDRLLAELPELTVSDSFHQRINAALKAGRENLLHRIYACVVKCLEMFIQSTFLRLPIKGDMLKEFDDLPPRSFGEIYFKLLGEREAEGWR